MRFLRPDYAVWFAVLPLVIGAWVIHARARARFRAVAVPRSLRRASRLPTQARDAAVLVAAVVAVAGVVAALMRPQVLATTETPEYAKEDLVIILDHSASMGARDVPPSRFVRAIAEVREFLRHKPDIIDRVGLVEFAGTSLILSHLTADIDGLVFYLEWIGESPDVRFGTDLGAALASARELARKDDRTTRKVFLVISDGADQGRQLASQLTALRGERTRVYTVGIGAQGDAVIPVLDERGTETLLRDDQGDVLRAGFDETTLRDIASQTGGRYVRSVTGADLSIALQDVIARERRLLSVTSTQEYQDVYRTCLAVAVVAGGLLLMLL